MRHTRLLPAIAAFAVAACAASPERSATFDAATTPPAVPISADEVIARTHVAFVRDDSGALVSAGSGWTARASSAGLQLAVSRGEPALRAHPARITRGGWECDAEAQIDAAADGSAVREVCAGAREELVPRADGVELRWRFDRAPGGDGDLVVRVGLDGADRIDATDDGGARLEGEFGAFVVGAATWIDAAGTRVAIPLSARSDALEMRVPAAVLARTTYPALLDPLLGPERAIADHTLELRGTGNNPAIAWNGSTFLVVFEDTSPARPPRELRGMRIDATGAVLDPLGFSIRAGYGGEDPSVVWTGSHWVVAYRAYEALEVVRVAASGAVLDAVPVELAPGPASSYGSPRLSLVGTTLFAVWFEPRHVYARRLDPDTLAFLDADPLDLDTNAVKVDLATDGVRLLVAWTGAPYYETLYSRVIEQDGTMSARVRPLGTAHIERFATTWAGTSFVISHTPRYDAVWLVQIAIDGTTIGAPFVVDAAAIRSESIVHWDGARLQVGVWRPSGTRATFGIAQVDLTATPPFVQPTVTIGAFSSNGHAALATGGGTTLAVWGEYQLFASRLGPGPVALDDPPIILQRSANAQLAPSIAWNGSVHLVAWRDDRSDAPGIYALRVAPDGMPLDALGTWLGVGDAGSEPSVLALGPTFHVVWRETDPTDGADYLRARSVSADGTTLGTLDTLELGATARPFAIAANATEIRVAYQVGTPVTRAFGADHRPLGPAVATGLAIADSLWIDAADDRWAVLANARRSASDTELVLQRLATDGSALGARVILETPSWTAVAADLAADRDGYLAVWSSRASSTYGAQLAARVRVDGSTAFQRAITPGPDTTLGFHDGMHLVAIRDTRASNRAAFLRLDGTLQAPFELTPTLTPTLEDASSAPDGRTLVAYTLYDPSTPGRNTRVRVRLVEPDGALGSACTSGADCETGLCVDGVCCDQACGGGAISDCLACSVSGGASDDGVCTTLSAAVVCRAAGSVCGAEERCDGTSPTCPADVSAANGTPCPNGLACDGEETCSSGVCAPGALPECDLGDVCTTYACVEPTGCAATPREGCCRTDADCADDSACTMDACATSTGACTHTPIAGCCIGDAECDDGEPCTIDACVALSCTHAIAPMCVDAGVDGGPPPLDAGSEPDAAIPLDAGAARDAGDARDGGAAHDAGDARDGGGARDAHVEPEPDAGVAIDAAVEVDSGARSDGGPSVDASAWDADVTIDAAIDPDDDAGSIGADASSEPTPSSGCGCSAVGRAATTGHLRFSALLLALACIRMARRRRGRRAHGRRSAFGGCDDDGALANGRGARL